MTQQELLKFIYSVYPKKTWESFNMRDYRKSEEHKRYRYLRSLRMNNFSKKIERLMKKEGNILVNQNRSYDYCFEYYILCNHIKDLMDDDRLLLQSIGGKRTDVYLYISKLTNIFTMECSETTLNTTDTYDEWTFRNVPFYGNPKEVFDILYRFLSNNGLIFIDVSELNYIVPDIATELTGLGETTLFDLLFTPFHEFYEEKKMKL